MPNRLDEQKRTVQKKRNNGRKHQLRFAEGWTRLVMVTFGKTSVRVVSAINTDSAALVPCSWNDCTRCNTPPVSKQSPMIPLHTIITAENRVSRASPVVSVPPVIVIDTISATSMTVTATASTSVPNGSPVVGNDLGVVHRGEYRGDQRYAL